jgi:hypothetical protein
MDPGLRNGYAIMGPGGSLEAKGSILLEDLPEFLSQLPGEFTVAVVEDFKLFRSKAIQQSGKTMQASEAIGILTGWAKTHSVRLVRQPPEAYHLGAKYVQYKLPRGHTPDDISAWLHGIYYLKSINQLTTPLERRLQHDQ